MLALYEALCMPACSVTSAVSDSVTPWTGAHQAPLFTGFSRQDYWSGLPCPPLRELLDPGIELRSPALQADSLPLSPRGSPIGYCTIYLTSSSDFTALLAQSQGCCFCSVTESCLTLWDPHGLQHASLPCPLLSPRSCSNSCPSSQWCHPTISSSVISFSSWLQSFPASGCFQMSQLFASGGQSFGASASASVLPMRIQGWFPLGLSGWISLQSKRLSRVFSSTTVQKHLWHSAIFMVQFSHLYTTIGKTIALTVWAFVGKVMSLLFNVMSIFVIAFLPRSKKSWAINSYYFRAGKNLKDWRSFGLLCDEHAHYAIPLAIHHLMLSWSPLELSTSHCSSFHG